MQINLTWDLFIIVFFIITIAYSYIIWANKTLKLIFWSYISILVSDWVWNLIIKWTTMFGPMLWFTWLSSWDSIIIITKISFFLLWMVVLWTNSNFNVKMPEWVSWIKKIFALLFFSLMNASVFVATILVFVAWWSFLSEQWVKMMTLSLSNIYHNSYIVQLIILNYNLIFIIPIVTFIALSYKREWWWESEEIELSEEE